MQDARLDSKIRYFIEIARSCSLSRAAEDLGISQSALSRQLGLLEAYIRKPLFHRTGRGLRLTNAGEKLFAEASVHYEEVDATIRYLRNQEGITEGKLGIATTYSIGLGFVSELLDTFINQQTGVSLSVTSGASPQVVELVEKRVVDIGFVYDSAVASAMLESVALYDNAMCLIGREGDIDCERPIDLNKENLPLVSYPENYALREMLRSAHLDGQIVAEANTLEIILRLVSSGVGLCILPGRLPTRMLKERNLVKNPHITPALSRRVVAVVRQNTVGPLARKLFDSAREFSRLPM